jgi:hypothetical protein
MEIIPLPYGFQHAKSEISKTRTVGLDVRGKVHVYTFLAGRFDLQEGTRAGPSWIFADPRHDRDHATSFEFQRPAPLGANVNSSLD